MQILAITEIRDIAAQGVTKPVFCCAEDDNTYVVKGAYAGAEALIHEWIASRLGHLAGLPIPKCAMLKIGPEMFKYSSQKKELNILGPSTLFGSLWEENMVELRHADISQISLELRAEVLAFDTWVGNGDRTLSINGGNPNLLWSPSEMRLAVIDHNLAFDYTDSLINFTDHVFYEARTAWSPNFRQEMENRFSKALKYLDTILQEVPREWLESSDQDYLVKIGSSLSRFRDESATFWGLS